MATVFVLGYQNLTEWIQQYFFYYTFEVRVEPVMLIKFAPASVASTLARRVFPVPGGPKSKIPLQGWKKALQNHTLRKG